MYTIILSCQAQKDKVLLKQANLGSKATALLDLMSVDPFRNPPSYEKLQGDLKDLYSRRINRQHRIVYGVDERMKIVHVLRMWTHYE